MFRRIIIAFFFIMIFTANWAMAQQAPRAYLFDQMDSDGNGQISEQEWHSSMQKRFEAIDRNNDGNISPQEWQEMKNTMRDRLRSRIRDRSW